MRQLFLLTILCTTLLGVLTKSTAQCGPYRLYINPLLVRESRNPPYSIDQWKTDNPGMYVCPGETENEIIVDLARFEAPKNVPSWRENNSSFIDFEKSRDYIRNAHFLNPAEDYMTEIELTEERINEGDFVGLTFKELVDRFNIDYANPSYKNYLRVKRTTIFKNIKVSSRDEFEEGSFLFTSPLLYSIMKDIGITESNTDEFGKCFFSFTIIAVPDLYTKKDTQEAINYTYKAMMKFTYKGKNYYYDFSDDPIRSLLKK
ncbi:hypothetical protein [Flavobacterium sp.]|uniref:hypothetical protein n=1 Tax=Flavobacterium sp. TaxID=239 RepID=UPI00262B26C0|nr:hypothetical protein [Flavobacterium sp.]